MIRSLFCLILVVFILNSSWSQVPILPKDSLAKEMAKPAKNDSNHVILLLEYAKCFLHSNPDTAILLSKQVISLATKIKYSNGIIRGHNSLAVAYWYQNKPNLAIAEFHTAYQIADHYKNQDLKAKTYNNLGVYYSVLGYMDSAEKYESLGLELAKSLKDKITYAKSLSDLGMTYSNQNKYYQAIQCLLEAINIYKEKDSKFDLALSYTKIGNLYYSLKNFDQAMMSFRMGLNAVDKLSDISLKISLFQNIGLMYLEGYNKIDSARIYTQRALDLALKSNRSDFELSSNINLGNIAYKEKNFPLALKYYLEAYNHPLVHQRNRELTAVLVNLGRAYLDLNQIEKSQRFAKEGLEMAQKYSFKVFESNAVKLLSELAVKKKNYTDAFKYLEMYMVLKDSIGNEEVKQKVAEAVYNNAITQKEKENLILVKENELKQKTIHMQWVYIATALLILLLFIKLLINKSKYSKKLLGLNKELDAKNQELRELNLTKDKFFSIIAHDLRSPFNGLLGFLNVLDENYDSFDEARRRKIISSLKQSSRNTYNLLVNLLDWIQSQRGQIKMVKQEVSVKELVAEVMSVLSTRSMDKEQEIFMSIQDDMIIYSDPQIIKGILLNIVNNAIKFTGKGGKITVSAVHLNNWVRFEIADNGMGIPVEEVEKLFRIDTKYQRKGTIDEPGTGLGLIMCKEFVSILGGDIGVESRFKEGSTFYFTIPYHEVPEEFQTHNHPREEKDRLAIKEKKLKILIVEDDTTSDLLLTKSFSPLNAEILHTKFGQDAVELCQKHADIDLVMMDINLPDTNGYEATRKIRQFNKSIIIIAETAYGLSGDREKALNAGCNDYISKPFQPSELMILVRKYL